MRPSSLSLTYWGEGLFQRSAIFFPHIHGTAGIIHLNAWFKLQHVGSQHSESGTPAAFIQELQRIDDKTRLAVACQRLYFLGDLCGGHAGGDTFRGLDHQQSGAGGQIPAVDGIYARQLLCRQTAVIIGSGQTGSQREMDHFVSLIQSTA